MDKINIIVFSRNRAMQLDLNLRTFARAFKEFSDHEISVVYDFTDMQFIEGYEKLREQTYSNVKFYTDHQFGSLKDTLMGLMRPENKYTMYLCDDNIFTDQWSVNDPEIKIMDAESSVMSTSLRLWKGIDFCYATNKPSPVPNFIKNFCWDWRETSGDWGYPMSCDGNIYRTEFLRQKTQTLNFVYPNNFEAGLAGTADHSIPLTSCYLDGPKVYNIPVNVVQHIYPNRHGNIQTPEYLNELWLRDKSLDINFYYGKKFNTVHKELELKFV